MPRRTSREVRQRESSDDDVRRPRRSSSRKAAYKEIESDETDSTGSSDNILTMVHRQSQRKSQRQRQRQVVDEPRRLSSRSARFTGSLKEPPSESLRDLLGGHTGRLPAKRTKANVVKSPARRHAKARKTLYDDCDSDDSTHPDKNSDDDEEEDDDEEGQELKMQRILATRTETKAKWREICKSMNSSEITAGSIWDQTNNNNPSEDDDEVVEERFLVKWADLSYLHVSWETQADLLDQIPKAKSYLATFFRKAQQGVLLSPEDRNDGDYFDPAYTLVGRILETAFDGKHPKSWEEEMATTPDQLGIVLDPKSKAFEAGTGRQFLIKWEGLNYSESSWEFERDLILAEIDYQPLLKSFYQRTRKPTKTEWKQLQSSADRALRESYQLFGDNAPQSSQRQDQVQKYQEGLMETVYPNGGQLRDYQAEGVTWFLANYVNQRSCILADEMGLGKTLQTAAFLLLLATKLHRPGPFLVVVPLSTIAHWQREFHSWTGLNTIVYHGSAEDRVNIRIHEFAFSSDRPDSVGSNAIYLNKCIPHKSGGPWMATVVICTPEMLVAEDANELAALPWEVLVVDEAHRLKNHNSKLAMTLRKDLFSFRHKILLTGTPIQNDMKEFWTLLNFIDNPKFPDLESFLLQYGSIKSKEHIDEMHEVIRPYILRRLKEDVEKSVPPKEETLIEVELTLQQKQYYRALYEKNVAFLQKNKKKALDGPSLNNLAMQLRKVCNHLFLLNGVEEEIRKQKENKDLNEVDLLVRGSGKLVLLDKLLPRLKENGHRVLIFSQFKIMLDVLEDYLAAKHLKFERIDGSITGHRRQAAIDRFQDPNAADPPFVMLLSTRAGGVGINLTSADTCIIFDSDWNPQNDLQAQARCHRIGQTKNVKVYRLLSRKSYEMQMFHMSSLKMGLDQAVLKGFESGASGEGAMTKEEVERLLRHGAYDIFNEEKAGTAEAESKHFIEQDIDSILQRRSRTVVHENTGSGSNAAGGTFSKASFIAPTTPGSGQDKQHQDVDIEDPDFWKKMIGETEVEVESELKPRRRNQANYSERFHQRKLHKAIALSSSASGSDDSESDDDDGSGSDEDLDDDDIERVRWGGKQPHHWTKSQALKMLEAIERYGYRVLTWEEFRNAVLPDCDKFSETEIMRMTWAITLMSFCEVAKEDAVSASKRAERQAMRKRESERDGDILAVSQKEEAPSLEDQKEKFFAKVWNLNAKWANMALMDAIQYARDNEPRAIDAKDRKEEEIAKLFYGSLWDSLKGRGWKEEETGGIKSFWFENHKFDSPSSVLNEVVRIHPELSKMAIPLLQALEQRRLSKSQKEEQDRTSHLTLDSKTIKLATLTDFLVRYAPLQLLGERRHMKRLPVGRRILSSCNYMFMTSQLRRHANLMKTELRNVLSVDLRSALPHPLWNIDHDALLIEAIAKHGWIERDKACRKIAADSGLKWGFPFQASDADATSRLSDDEWKDLQDTAKRASYFLDDSEVLLDGLKGFNRHLIIESYGLKHVDEDDGASGSRKWLVDDELLLNASEKSHNNSKTSEVVDLPTRKDLAKRAKLVLQKSFAVAESGGWVSSTTGSSKNSNNTGKDTLDHGFAVIDQGNHFCILLAEMIRGICRGSLTKSGKQVKLLCSMAYEEAVNLKNLFSRLQSEKAKQRVHEMDRIVNQIQLARQSMKVSAVPGKNLLRVMIGLEPIQPKIATDPMFPSQDYLDKSSAALVQQKKENFRKDDGALGEKAMIRALKRAVEKSEHGVPSFFSEADDPDDGMQLTMAESIILLVFCMDGVPTSSSSNSTGSLSWKDSCASISVSAREFYGSAQEKVEKLKLSLERLDTQGANAAQHEAAKKIASEIVAEEWKEALAEEAVRHCADISPDMLAKKSIMLLEKVRRFAFSSLQTSQKSAHKFENYLGPKVLSWIGKEIAFMGTEYNVVDGNGKPLCYSTTDLLSSNPEHSNTRVAAYLDKKSARHVISQISLLSRLRALFTKYDSGEFREKLADAIGRSRKLTDVWEKRPSWWEDEDGKIDHSYLLLERLNDHGFANILGCKVDFGIPEEERSGESFRDLGFTKLSIQQRANQLVRELHAIDETSETMRLLEERRNRGALKKQGYDRSLAECHKSGSSGIQTGLKAFFTSTMNASRKQKVVLLSEDDENAVRGKRKESPVQLQESTPCEKTPKKLAPLFVMPSKRKGDESPNSESPTEKKLRTVVNPDGVIELVSVPK